MKKTGLFLMAIGIVSLIAIFAIKYNGFIIHLLEKWKGNTIEANPSSPVLAVFSFQAGAINSTFDNFPHYTVKLKNLDNWDPKQNLPASIPDSIPVMITVETWGSLSNFNTRKQPLVDLLNGNYDHLIEQLCTSPLGKRPNIFFRFNPEMEIPANVYSWQLFGLYIKAYRYFYSLCKIYAPQIKQVWGPAAYPGVMDHYPGDEFVDAASITLKSDSEMTLNVYPKNYAVEYDLLRRLHRLRFIDKPIFVIGSKQNHNDSVDNFLISSITDHVDQNRSIMYSTDNFQRPELNSKDSLKTQFEIGVYDPLSLLNNEEQITVEHLFVDFGSLHNGSFQISFNEVIDRGHNVIVSFEPFRYPNEETDLEVLQHVTEGKYDNEIGELYDILLSAKRQVYLRYAHEMEIPITRYPWQSQNPIDYIKSFRYFMNFHDTLPGTISRVWGPAGDRGSIEWYPGNDVVDFKSIAIYGLPDKNITDPKKQESFQTIFNRKYRRLKLIDKPLFITEFGVKGPEDFQAKWLEEAAKVIRKNQGIKGINYFNMSDTPKAWGDIAPPDWKISKKTFNDFANALGKK